MLRQFVDPLHYADYDDVEVLPMVEVTIGDSDDTTCEVAIDPSIASFWSVYGHVSGRGLECISDHDDRAAAEEFGARIMDVINSMRRCPCQVAQ